MSTHINSSVERFFKGNSLPWSTTIQQELCKFGVECVEHIKVLKLEEWIAVFPNPNVILKRIATKVHEDLLKDGEVDPKKCAIELGISNAVASSVSPRKSSATKGRFKDDGTTKDLRTCLGFTVIKKVTKEENKRRRLERKRAAEALADAVNEDAYIGSSVGNGGVLPASASAAASAAVGGNDTVGDDEEGDDDHETVGNYSWGKKDSGRRNVKTGGREKDRFTCQLSIAKDGTKLPPFIIWKGKFIYLSSTQMSWCALSNISVLLYSETKPRPSPLVKRVVTKHP